MKVLFQNPQLRIVLTNVEEYAGDALEIRFESMGGFIPEAVSQSDVVTLAARILAGPTKIPESPHFPVGGGGYTAFPYLYVVDQGRASAGSRGQIMRINPRAVDSSARLQGSGRFDSSFTGSTFPIQ